MESVQDKHLTVEEKEKLKERLALLKKEYRRTVNRLQRSQRAERVKIHVKQTIEEQNRLLVQECPVTDGGLASAGPVGSTSNASEDARRSQDVVESHTPFQERKSSVTFNLEPNIVQTDGRTTPCSGGESSGQEAEENGAQYCNQVSRSRLRLSRSSRRVCFSESPSPNICRLSSMVNVLDGQEKVAFGKRLSPVFKKNPSEDFAIEQNKVNCLLKGSKSVDLSSEILGGPGNDMLIMGTVDNSPGHANALKTVSMHSDTELFQAHKFGDSGVCIEPNQLQSTEEQPQMITKSLDSEKPDTTCDPSVTPTGAPKTMSTRSPPSKSKPEQNLILPEEDRNPLSSCTLVEGLLFPVEYYVRTTRRMTSCQRKVDLDAVISSHLGTARRRTTGRPRRNSTSLSTPQNTSDSCSTPLSCSSISKGATRSRRGKGRKSCPALLSPGLNDVSVQLQFGSENFSSRSEKENCDETSSPASKKEAHSKVITNTDVTDGTQMVKDFTPSVFEKKTFCPGSPEPTGVLPATQNVGGKLDKLQGLGEAAEPIASPFPRLNSKVTLACLSYCLDVTDFHLPDEDFGLLKLEKLKCSNRLDVLTPHTPKERKTTQRSKNKRTTALSRGSRAALHESEKAAGNELEINKLCLKDKPSDLNKQETLDNSDVSLAKLLEPSSTVTSEQACASLLQYSLVETTDKTYYSHSYKTDPMPSNMCDDPIRVGFIPGQPPPNREMSKLFTTTSAPHPDNSQEPVSDSCAKYTDPEPTRDSPATNINGEINPFMNSPLKTKTQNSPNERTSDVLFSTSLCSVPLEGMNNSVAPSCTPKFPCLGSTPAVFSKSLTDKEQEKSPHQNLFMEDGARFILPASRDEVDIRQSSDVLEKLGDSVGHQEKQSPQRNNENDKAESFYEFTRKSNDEELEAEQGGCLRLVSKIRDSCGGGGCAVDLCTVWWDFSGCTELCIVCASESSVCLWRPRMKETWECFHTWSFKEMPVIQVLPLAQEKNMLCVALGNLEIMEIWAVLSPQERLGTEKQLVKRGHIKTARGLSQYRLVISGRVRDSQAVELYQLSEIGSTVQSLTLMSPKDSVLAFCELDGERNALIGSTIDNYVVVWNMVTGHLLSVIYLGDLCSDLICLHASSDSGILFLVVGSRLSSHCEEAGSCVFKLIATNPRGGASTLVMSYMIPDKPNSRYLEGDATPHSMAAVLTCGSIALWDLRRSRCSVILPPSMDTPWCLVRWGHQPARLLTGQKEGTICMFEYVMCC